MEALFMTGGTGFVGGALACRMLERGDIGSLHAESGDFVRLFNPRTDRWGEHFRLEGAIIEPLTGVGAVTVDVLRLNSFERVLEREALVEAGRYPPEHASEDVRY